MSRINNLYGHDYTNIRVMSLNRLNVAEDSITHRHIDRGHSTPRTPPRKGHHLRSSLLLLSSFDYSKGEYTYGWYSASEGNNAMQSLTMV